MGTSEHIRIGQIEQGQNTSEQGHQNTRTPLEHQNTTRTPEFHQNPTRTGVLSGGGVLVFLCSATRTTRTPKHLQNTRTPEVQNTRSPEHHPKARKPPEHQNSTRTRSSVGVRAAGFCYAGPRTSDLALRPSGGSQGNFPDRGPVWGTRPRQPLLWREGVQTSERLNYVERLRWVILGKGGD